MINWDDIRYFVEVARAGSVSAASKNLGVSHATVLRHIAQLEEDLQTRLFDHFQSGYKATVTGNDILGPALSIESNVNALIRKIKGKESSAEGLLKISLPESALFNISKAIGQFTREYPQIELLILGPDEAGDITQLEVDVAIQITNNPPDDLVGRQISQLSFGYYASTAYLAEKNMLIENDSVTPYKSTTDHYDWIIWQLSSKRRLDMQLDQQENWLQFITPNPHIILRATSHTEILSAVSAGVGIGLLSNVVAEKVPNLIRLPFPDKAGKYGVWVLTHPELRLSARVKAFMRFASEALLSVP